MYKIGIAVFMVNKIIFFIYKYFRKKFKFVIPPGISREKLFKIHFLDIGAADGLNDNMLWLKEILKVSAFEPDYRSNEALKKLLKKQGVSEFSVHNNSISSKEESKTLYLTKKPKCSSLFKPNFQLIEALGIESKFEIVEKVEVDCTTIDKKVESTDWIKLDIQGYELEALKGAEKNLQDTIVVSSEIEFIDLYEGQPTYTEIDNFLQSKGFQIIEMITNRRPFKTKVQSTLISFFDEKMLVDGEAIFLNRKYLPYNLAETSINPEKLTKAILILMHYKKLSLAFAIIDRAIDLQLFDDRSVQILLDIFNANGISNTSLKKITSIPGLGGLNFQKIEINELKKHV